MTGVHEGFLDTGAVRLHYTDRDGTVERPVLLLHGANSELHSWDPVADRLAQRRRVVCLDLRGHGDSDWTREGYRIAAFAGDVAALVAHLDLREIDVVGHSLGARIAIARAGTHPHTVRRLVLSEGAPETPHNAAKQAQGILGNAGMPRGFRDEDAALAYVRAAHPEWQPPGHGLWVRHHLRRNWAGKLVPKTDPDIFWLSGSAGLADIPWLWEMCSRITAPALLLRGTRSAFLDDAIVARMRESIAGLEVQTVDAGHFLPREAPDAMARVIEDFLDR